jgi:hypothetical protein
MVESTTNLAHWNCWDTNCGEENISLKNNCPVCKNKIELYD